jgi:segregation and condensation protein B
MRTLAIVAAKQPIKQSLIVKYQGNKAYGYVVGLEKKGLIRTEKYGRTKLITTTPDFEKYFGKSSEEIKKILKTEKSAPS